MDGEVSGGEPSRPEVLRVAYSVLDPGAGAVPSFQERQLSSGCLGRHDLVAVSVGLLEQRESRARWGRSRRTFRRMPAVQLDRCNMSVISAAYRSHAPSHRHQWRRSGLVRHLCDTPLSVVVFVCDRGRRTSAARRPHAPKARLTYYRAAIRQLLGSRHWGQGTGVGITESTHRGYKRELAVGASPHTRSTRTARAMARSHAALNSTRSHLPSSGWGSPLPGRSLFALECHMGTTRTAWAAGNGPLGKNGRGAHPRAGR